MQENIELNELQFDSEFTEKFISERISADGYVEFKDPSDMEMK